MSALDNISAGGSVASALMNYMKTNAAGSLGGDAMSAITSGSANSGGVSGSDLATIMAGLGKDLNGLAQTTQAYDEFEKEDKMIQQMAKAAKTTYDDSAIL